MKLCLRLFDKEYGTVESVGGGLEYGGEDPRAVEATMTEMGWKPGMDPEEFLEDVWRRMSGISNAARMDSRKKYL